MESARQPGTSRLPQQQIGEGGVFAMDEGLLLIRNIPPQTGVAISGPVAGVPGQEGRAGPSGLLDRHSSRQIHIGAVHTSLRGRPRRAWGPGARLRRESRRRPSPLPGPVNAVIAAAPPLRKPQATRRDLTRSRVVLRRLLPPSAPTR